MSGINGPNSDNEPMYDAVSKQIRPNVVHETMSNGRNFGDTKSPVLDTITAIVALTNVFNVKFITIASHG